MTERRPIWKVPWRNVVTAEARGSDIKRATSMPPPPPFRTTNLSCGGRAGNRRTSCVINSRQRAMEEMIKMTGDTHSTWWLASVRRTTCSVRNGWRLEDSRVGRSRLFPQELVGTRSYRVLPFDRLWHYTTNAAWDVNERGGCEVQTSVCM